MASLRDLLVTLTRRPGLDRVSFTTGVQTNATGSYVGTTTGANAARAVASTDLADLNVAGVGSDTDDSWYEGWLWLPDLGIQRRVAQGGYSAAEAAADATDQTASDEIVGVVTVSRTLGQTVAGGTPAELYSPLPPLFDDDKRPSLRTYLNRALHTLRMRTRITLTGVADARRYSLSAYPWIADVDDLIGVYDAEPQANQDGYPVLGRPAIRFENETPYLLLDAPMTAGATFYVDLWRRRDTWIKAGGTWATSTTGLVDLDDEATGDAEIVSLLAYYFLADEFAYRAGEGTDMAWEKRKQMVAAKVAPYLAWGQGRAETPSERDARYGGWGDSPGFVRRRIGGGIGGYGYGTSRRWR